MSDREEMVALADWLSEQQSFHDGSLARNDPFIQTHIERLRQWEKLVRSTARTGPDVVVKPLRWEKHPDDDEWYSYDEGHYQVSDYVVDRNPASTTAWRMRVRGYLLEQDFESLDAAKAAAQADFEQRIRSAITATVGTAEPGYQAGFEACREAARKCADDLIRICEAAARVTSRTGNTFVLDREKVATMIAGYFAALPAPAGESVTGWRPIETAPMDGSLILAASNITGTRWVVGWQPADPSQMEPFCEAHWNNVGSKNAAPAIYINANYFTHWQPLPPAPTITRKSKNEEAGS